MKKYPLFIAALFLAPVVFLFAACGQEKLNISNTTLTIEYSETRYNGSAKTPNISISYRNQPISTENFVCEYENNTDAGIATVTIKGINELTGTAKMHFEIVPRVLNQSNVNEIYSTTYTGTEYAPVPIVYDITQLKAGTDYEYTYSNNIDAGIGKLVVSGINNYSGSVTKTFLISQKSLSSLRVDSINNHTYNGNPIQPPVVIKDGQKTLVQDKDYTVSYSDNISVGTATAFIKGIGNYTDSITKTFKIVQKTLSLSMIEGLGSYEYTGSAIIPEITITDGSNLLTEDIDYTLEMGNNNVQPDTVKVIIKGINNYNGYIETSYTIVKKDLGGLIITPINAVDYNGTAHTPQVEVKLNDLNFPSENYDLNYVNNIDVGTASVILSAKHDSILYKGSKIAYFTINPIPFNDSGNIMQPNGTTFNNSSQPPVIEVKLNNGDLLVLGEDYTISYTRNNEVTDDFTNAGLIKVSITCIKNYYGNDFVFYLISQAKLTDTKLEIQQNIVYDGQPKTPVTLTYLNTQLKEGTDYEIVYTNNIEAGTAEFTITAKENSNFSGSLSGTFTINPAEE